jgi:iron complex transport system substrate-binding protein
VTRGKAGRVRRSLACAVALVALAGGCAGTDPQVAPNSRRGATMARHPGFPVTLSDCGREVQLSAPPRRVVILNPAIADILIDLGVGDRIIAQSGTNFGTARPQDKARMDRVPVLARGSQTGTEALLDAGPDAVIGTSAAELNPNFGGASLSVLRASGIDIYVSAGGCGDGVNPRVTDVFTDIENCGAIFGVPQNARMMAGRLRDRLAAVEARVGGKPKVRVFEFFREPGGQFLSFGPGVENDALDRSGGITIVPELRGSEQLVGAETITERNPQVLIEVTYPGMPIDRTKEAAALRATFPTTDAAKHQRIYFLDLVRTSVPGTPRIIEGIAARAELLHPDAIAAR